MKTNRIVILLSLILSWGAVGLLAAVPDVIETAKQLTTAYGEGVGEADSDEDRRLALEVKFVDIDAGVLHVLYAQAQKRGRVKPADDPDVLRLLGDVKIHAEGVIEHLKKRPVRSDSRRLQKLAEQLVARVKACLGMTTKVVVLTPKLKLNAHEPKEK